MRFLRICISSRSSRSSGSSPRNGYCCAHRSTRSIFKRIANADLGFGLAAVAVLVTGALRVFYGAKGTAFYLHNPVFHVKVALFVLVGLVSIAPTLAFLRWRRAWTADAAFRITPHEYARVRRFILIELHLIALIPIAAVMMARGLR